MSLFPLVFLAYLHAYSLVDDDNYPIILEMHSDWIPEYLELVRAYRVYEPSHPKRTYEEAFLETSHTQLKIKFL
ncbi:hypothetical protein SCHPADRAFT_947030 [Schizopora paradoxa]|uniref:Uncharacterized protein n=1 Tax=Schizopora paradoxa TaxID=27342 RepID=A0A0H2RKG5_9AGAM|nr:hypothetical protein SCHPADRAFT_947030 [Schizopora paradoxa]